MPPRAAAEAAGRIAGALERVGLAERADERVKSYSMGMRQRLGIARCLLADPALLILDEPMNGLDPAGILEFRSLIRSFVDEGRTVFLSSHLLDEVERTCDMVAIVDQGRIVRQGPIAEIAGGDGAALAIECDDPAAAWRVLARRRDVESRGRAGRCAARRARGGRRRRPRSTARSSLAGIGVRRLEPARISLEERFLELTSSLGGERMIELVRADLLKLRKRRGLFWWSLVLTAGSMLAYYGVKEVLHLSDSVGNGPAGGRDTTPARWTCSCSRRPSRARSIGTTAGSGDRGAGVFRDLVATGRSRVALSLARVPAALALIVPLALLGFVTATVACFAFASGLPTPSASEVAWYGGYIVASAVADVRRRPRPGRAHRLARHRDRRAAGLVPGRRAARAQHLRARPGTRRARRRRVDRLRPLHRAGRFPRAERLARGRRWASLALWLVVPTVAGAWRAQTRDA